MSQLHRHLNNNNNSSHRYNTTTQIQCYMNTTLLLHVCITIQHTLSTNSLSYLLLVISSVRVAHSASLNMGQAIKFNLLHTFSSPLFATVHPLLLLRLASSQPPADPVIVYCLLLCNKENAFDLHHNSCLLTLKTESPLTPQRSVAAAAPPHVAASGEIYWMSWLCVLTHLHDIHTHTHNSLQQSLETARLLICGHQE